MELVYNKQNAELGNTPAFNGNITGNIWQTAQPSSTPTPVTTGIKAYKYTYDKLNRLLTGQFSENWVLNNKYSEYIDISSLVPVVPGVPAPKPYDLNGNILNLYRYGLRNNLNATIDELKYTYDGNKLIAVDDGVITNNGGDFMDNGRYYSTNPTPEYAYDANGNLTRDDNKKIVNITYNYLNLPASIDNIGGDRIEYIYDAAGNKRQQVYLINGIPSKTTDFVGNFVYENFVPAYAMNTEGRVILNSIGTAYCKEVYLKDHLGNVRVTLRRESGVLKVRQVDSYYPFGMNIKGLSVTTTVGIRPNEYLYNGKMMQDEMGLNWLDYGARFYDPVLGRWHSVDPKAGKYFSWTPFVYVGNNPIRLIDPNGKEWVDGKGNLIYDPQANGGKGGYTSYSSANDRNIGNALLSTKTGTEQFNKLIAPGQSTKIVINSGGPIKDSKGLILGSAKNTSPEGKTDIQIEGGKIKADVKESTITINLGSIDAVLDAAKDKNNVVTLANGVTIKDETFSDLVGAVAGEEIEHTTDENMTINQNGGNFEAPANKVSAQILLEAKQKREEKQK